MALRRKANNRPRTKFSTCTDLLSDQVPDTIVRSQQTLLLGTLVILDLWSREDTGVNGQGLGIDLDAPVLEILKSDCTIIELNRVLVIRIEGHAFFYGTNPLVWRLRLVNIH